MNAQVKAGAARKSPAKRKSPKTKSTDSLPKGPDSIPSDAWLPTSDAVVLPGFAYGLPYPSVVFQCRIPATTTRQRQMLAARFAALFEGAEGAAALGGLESGSADKTIGATARWFAKLCGHLQQLAGLPVVVPARVIAGTAHSTLFAFPTLIRGAEPTVRLLQIVCRAFAASEEGASQASRQRASDEIARLRAANLTTSNTPRFVSAAVENRIAFQELPDSMVLFGIGAKSMLTHSTFTQECSVVASRIAKNKHGAAEILRRAGLPTPQSALAVSAEHAVHIARQLGFPVVLKPADKDGGLAVHADLRSEKEVTQAYANVAAASKYVLVEKFIPGRDYRVTVFRGKAIWAVERVPAGVTGDGRSTIRELVETVNADPRRSSAATAVLKPIRLEAEAEALLARDGLTADSVPPESAFVRLRRSSNVTNGGMPIAVTERMHPDNARVAERAAETIGLDLAGIDLIIPDIAVSWRKSGAGICEINAQPELGGLTAGSLYPKVLKELVRGDGHVPTIAVLGGRRAADVTERLAAAIGQRGICLGRHDWSGVHVGDEMLAAGRLHALAAGRMLTIDRRVEAILLGAFGPRAASEGLPVPVIDALLITGDVPQAPGRATQNAQALFTEGLLRIAPHCRSVVILADTAKIDPAIQAALDATVGNRRQVGDRDDAVFVERLVNAISNAVRKARESVAA